MAVKAPKSKRQSKVPAKPLLPLPIVAQHCLRAKELGRRQYAKSDRLLGELCARIKVGEEIDLSAEKKVVLADRFAAKTVVFQPTGFRRFELQVLDR